MDFPSNDEILGALEKSGYLFEQDVATLLANLGFTVDTSWAYPDPDQGKSREIDVRAVKQAFSHEASGVSIFVELLIECKDFSSPLVFLEQRKNAREINLPSPREFVFPVSKYQRRKSENSYTEVAAFSHLELQKKHYYYQSEKKAVQFAKIVREQKSWKANHDGIYDALILPLAKGVEHRRREMLDLIKRYSELRAIWLFLPIVVVRDHLFAYDLSVPDRQLSARERISYVRHLEMEALKGHYLIDFVTFGSLENFVCMEVAQFVAAIRELIEADSSKFVRS